MGLGVLLLGLAGLALCIWLFVRHGFRDIGAAVIAARWGVLAVVTFHLVPLICDAISWRVTIPRPQRLGLREMCLIRWIGDSVSAMLPVAQVGGEIVRIRLSALRGMKLSIAIASVLMGITFSIFTQIIFTLSGLAILLLITGHSSLARPVLLGSALGVLAAVGFYFFQRMGTFRFAAVILRHLRKSTGARDLVEGGQQIDADIRALYGRRSGMLACALWNMAVWLTGAGEVWIALHALGVRAGYSQAYVLESMSQGIRSVAFMIPGALGVQEGGILVVGALLGLSAETAMALALIRRVRELAFGLPGVAAWQLIEWRHYWGGAAPAKTVASTEPPQVEST